MLSKFWRDESGLVSIEVILLSTLLVIAVIVGISEFQDAVTNEMNDLSESTGSLNQSLEVHGQSGQASGRSKSSTRGAAFRDRTDSCDRNECEVSCDAPVGELTKVR